MPLRQWDNSASLGKKYCFQSSNVLILEVGDSPMLSPTIESFLVYGSTWSLNFLWSSLPCVYASLTPRGECTSTSDGLQLRFVWYSSYLANLDILFKYSLCFIRRRSAILHSFQIFLHSHHSNQGGTISSPPNVHQCYLHNHRLSGALSFSPLAFEFSCTQSAWSKNQRSHSSL